jgi:NADPH-dependent 7-cyano-7-deazaguanine reductase QueF
MIQTIPNDCRVQFIEYHPEFSIICSVGNAPFHGTINITYEPNDKLIEFLSFEEWLYSISKTNETIESLCRLVFDVLIENLGNIKLTVEVRAETQIHSPASARITSK